MNHILTMRCPDRPGILAAVTSKIAAEGGDIRDAVSYGDESTGEFFVRIEMRLPRPGSVKVVEEHVAELADETGLWWERHDQDERPKVLILVSKFDHCLADFLHRWKSGVLNIDITAVVSNHNDCRELVEWHGLPYIHLPVSRETRAEQEAEILRMVDEHDVDLVVLARYMQILSSGMCKALRGRCINIHHSFLPSFKGAMPYRQAHDRGVKLIGATAHYVTDDLDEGPIIEQDVRRVSHTSTVDEMTAIGRETESSVLARAVRWHLENRVLLNGTKTVVFS